MNILQVVESCGGGVGRHVRSLCEGAVSQGHMITVAYAPHRLDEAFRRFISDRRNEIHFVPLKLKREVSPASDLAGLLRLSRTIRRRGPFDVVHGHSSKGGALARLAGRFHGVPTVYTPHGLIMSSPGISKTKSTAYTLIERSLGHLATSRIVAVSEGEREFVLKLKLTPGERVKLIKNGVEDRDFEYFSEQKLAREDAKERPLTFGSIMRFSSPKTPGHLVEAFTHLSAMMPEVATRLVIAGDGELFAEVERQVHESGMGEKISLLGWRTDTREVLLGLDVFVLSSLSEGGSYTILDAMAAGLSIISTDVFGTQETIDQVPGNVIVPAGDPVALAQGMKRLTALSLHSPPRKALQKIGQANHLYVSSHFRQSETTRHTIEVYRELS